MSRQVHFWTVRWAGRGVIPETRTREVESPAELVEALQEAVLESDPTGVVCLEAGLGKRGEIHLTAPAWVVASLLELVGVES